MTDASPSRLPSPPPPQILANAADTLMAYDVVYSDVWGVVHDGFRAFETACEALSRFRANGGTVVLVSNAPVPAHRVADMLDARRVPRAAWDDIVSSGALALQHLKDKAYGRVHYIGPRDRDAAFFAMSGAKGVGLDDAEALVCTGLDDDVAETPQDYAERLRLARERGLPFVCANPDLVVDVGGRLYPCAGALADMYAAMGGEVFWAGKPYAAAYEGARAMAERLRGVAIETARVLVIGDALRTDLAGAAAQGIDAMFIGAGIHRGDVMEGGAFDPARLAALFGPGTPPARYAMPVLAW